jgi:hypothetical protein
MHQTKITDFGDVKERGKQLLDIADSLAAEQQSNGEFVRGVNNVKRRRK